MNYNNCIFTKYNNEVDMPRERLFFDEPPVTVSLRMPRTMIDVIKARAKENRRSLNQEIVDILQKALKMIEPETNSLLKKEPSQSDKE